MPSHNGFSLPQLLRSRCMQSVFNVFALVVQCVQFYLSAYCIACTAVDYRLFIYLLSSDFLVVCCVQCFFKFQRELVESRSCATKSQVCRVKTFTCHLLWKSHNGCYCVCFIVLIHTHFFLGAFDSIKKLFCANMRLIAFSI